MNLLERIHDNHVHTRRVRVLAELVAGFLPPEVSVLDVGSGDGLVPKLIEERRADVRFTGIDVMVRGHTHIPMQEFDGSHIPHRDDEVDFVMFLDVLHHTDDPSVLLREAARVARRGVIIKDHLCQGVLARPMLRFMDHVGNAHHGVVLPYNYWTLRQWDAAFAELGLLKSEWVEALHMYSWSIDWLFGRGLHFLALLGVGTSASD